MAVKWPTNNVVSIFADKTILHFVMVVKTRLHITAKHVTVIFVNFASFIAIKTMHLPKILKYRKY